MRPYLEEIRDHIDHLELEIDDEIWPLPKYRELLFTCLLYTSVLSLSGTAILPKAFGHSASREQRCQCHIIFIDVYKRQLLGESLLFSFPAGTKMFQFPALASCQAG